MLTLNSADFFRAYFPFFPINPKEYKDARKYAILRASKFIKLSDF